jgi:hypothetical protein
MEMDLIEQEHKLDRSSPNYYEESQRLRDQESRLRDVERVLNDANTNWIVDGDKPQRR